MLTNTRMDRFPERVIKRQIGYFGDLQSAREFVRKRLHKDGYDWKTINVIMGGGHYNENPYAILPDEEYDEEDGSLLECYGYLVIKK